MARNFNTAIAALTTVSEEHERRADAELSAAQSWLQRFVDTARQQVNACVPPPAKRQRVGRGKTKAVADGKENESQATLPPLPSKRTGPARRTRRAVLLETVAEEEPETEPAASEEKPAPAAANAAPRRTTRQTRAKMREEARAASCAAETTSSVVAKTPVAAPARTSRTAKSQAAASQTPAVMPPSLEAEPRTTRARATRSRSRKPESTPAATPTAKSTPPGPAATSPEAPLRHSAESAQPAQITPAAQQKTAEQAVSASAPSSSRQSESSAQQRPHASTTPPSAVCATPAETTDAAAAAAPASRDEPAHQSGMPAAESPSLVTDCRSQQGKQTTSHHANSFQAPSAAPDQPAAVACSSAAKCAERPSPGNAQVLTPAVRPATEQAGSTPAVACQPESPVPVTTERAAAAALPCSKPACNGSAPGTSPSLTEAVETPQTESAAPAETQLAHSDQLATADAAVSMLTTEQAAVETAQADTIATPLSMARLAAAALCAAANIPLPDSVPRSRANPTGSSSRSSTSDASARRPSDGTAVASQTENLAASAAPQAGMMSNVMSGFRSFLAPKAAQPEPLIGATRKNPVKVPALQAARLAKARAEEADAARQAKAEEIARRKAAKAQEEAAARVRAAEEARLKQQQREADERKRKAELRAKRAEEENKKKEAQQAEERKRKQEAARAQADAKRLKPVERPMPLGQRQPLAHRPPNMSAQANAAPATHKHQPSGGMLKMAEKQQPAAVRSAPLSSGNLPAKPAADLVDADRQKVAAQQPPDPTSSQPSQDTPSAPEAGSAGAQLEAPPAPANSSKKGMFAAATAFVLGAVRGTPPSVVAPAAGPQSYEISPYRSDCDTDEEDGDVPRKPVPSWAHGAALREQLLRQLTVDPDEIFQQHKKTCALNKVFGHEDPMRPKAGRDYSRRTSSGNWIDDRVTAKEQILYKKAMGYL